MAENTGLSDNTNQNINQALYGLNNDSISEQIKPGQLTYALNAQIDNFDGNSISYQNEQKNVFCNEFKPGYIVIGIHNITEQNRTILFLHNPHTYDSEIGYLDNLITCDYNDPTGLNKVESNDYVNNGYNSFVGDDCKCKSEDKSEMLSFYEKYKQNLSRTIDHNSNDCCKYTTVINAKCLNFNKEYPILNVVHRESGVNDDSVCGTEIYWTDGLNPRRYINLDDLPYKEIIEDCTRIKTGEIDCSLLDVDSNMEIPCIYPETISDGGSLVAGSYQFAVQYTNKKGQAYSSYFSVTNPVTIFKSIYGLDYNFQTDKAIKLLISGLDSRFVYVNIAVIKTINGTTSVELIGTHEVLNTSLEVVYTGNNATQIKLTIDDIFEKRPIYKTAKGLNVVDNVLMWYNLGSNERINYQSIASKIELNWETVQIPYNSSQGYNNGINSSLYRGYMRDEVYAFEIVFLLKNGHQTDGFHIPGRIADEYDLELIGENEDVLTRNNDDCTEDENIQPRWKVYNTGSVIDSDPRYDAAEDKDCYIGPYEYGKFSYWESAEKYPCNYDIWGNLADTPIRHHKFPDNIITHIHDNNSDSTDKNFEHKIFPIGVRIDLANIKNAIANSDLTDSQKEQITGYRIVRSDRVNNKSVIAKGLLYNVGAYTPASEGSENQEYFYPNYPFNDLGDDPFLTKLSNVDDGGFDIGLLSTLSSRIESVGAFLSTLESLLPTVSPVCYTNIDTCAGDPLGTPVIEIQNSELADLQNLIYVANQAQNLVLLDIASKLDYYNNIIGNGGFICQDNVADLTLDDTLFNNMVLAIEDIASSTAITNFNDIIDYITTNAVALNTHPNATEIFALRSTLTNLTSTNNSLQNALNLAEDGYTDYLDTLILLGEVSCEPSEIINSDFSRSRFTFHSPDTHFYQPFLGNILKLETIEGGSAIGNFVQVQGHAGHKLISAFSANLALVGGIAVGLLFSIQPKMKITGNALGFTTYYTPTLLPDLGTITEKALFWKSQFKTLIENLIPLKNYAWQYNATGFYNKYEPVLNTGYKQRSLDKEYYLLPGVQAVGDIFPINNWNRESSVYLKVDQDATPLLYPNDPSIIGSLNEDNSRVSYSSDKQIYSDILSYYASNKRKLLDQYGQMYSYNTVDTGYCGQFSLLNDYTGLTDVIFGGDIYINRFGLKRKLSYFLDNAVGKPDGVDIDYSTLSNVGKVNYWYSSTISKVPGSGFNGLMASILGYPTTSLDGNSNRLFYQNGRIYLYSYGIPYFFVESEVNVDHRQAGNNLEKDFYPNVGTGIPNDWLQEIKVPIVNDNHYIYNKSYSKQNKENFFTHLPLTFNKNQSCITDYSHRVVYSDPNR